VSPRRLLLVALVVGGVALVAAGVLVSRRGSSSATPAPATSATVPSSTVPTSTTPVKVTETPGENSRVMLVPVRGGRPHGITPDAVAVYFEGPTWSPDGRLLAMSRAECEGCPADLVVMRPNGTHRRVLVDTLDVTRPAWSPDGTRIAFGVPDGRILTVDVRTRRIVEVVRAQAAAIPKWSPNTRWIAYVANGSDGRPAIYRTRADGSGRPARLTSAGLQATDPAWSPDGREIVYSREDADGIWRLAAMRPNGTGTHELRPHSRVSQENAAFSRDGRRIAFTAVTAFGANRVGVMGSDGTRARLLTPATGAGSAALPAIRPDGSAIAYTEQPR
jgi:Tol biopolymer transport system component